MNSINISIVDDDENLRNSIIELIQLTLPDYSNGLGQNINCKGFQNGLAFMEYAQQGHQIDVVLLDLQMPELDGLGVLEVCKKLGLQFNFILFSSNFNPYYLKASEEYNIKGYIDKIFKKEQLFDAIKLAIEGGTFISPYCHNMFELIKEYKSKPTLKELVVAHLINEGLLEKEIAKQLKVNVKTVQTYKKRLIYKFGLKSIKEVLDNFWIKNIKH